VGCVVVDVAGVGWAAVGVLVEGVVGGGGVGVLGGGAGGLWVRGEVDEADSVLLVDAVRADGAPGNLVRLDGDDVAPAVATRLSPHQVGVADLLDGARWLDRYPRRVVLMGVIPQSIDLGLGLTPAVRDSLSELVDLVVAEALEMGFAFQPKNAAEPACAWHRVDVARLSGTG
jgi:hydrogenase maturation protease